jgi:hypothetical protein
MSWYFPQLSSLDAMLVLSFPSITPASAATMQSGRPESNLPLVVSCPSESFQR